MTLFQGLPGFFYRYIFLFNVSFSFFDPLFANLYFKGLKFNFLGDGIIFAVIANIHLLFFIFFYQLFRLGNGIFIARDQFFLFLDLILMFFQPYIVTGDLIFKVTDLFRQDATDLYYFIKLGIYRLQFMQCFEFFGNGVFHQLCIKYWVCIDI